jgi:glyceraldehyde-3-phosphate dehydrogenase (NAD(P))
MPDTVRVAVNGYGVIGKRVADAVRAQPDMELAGVSDVTTDYRIKTAVVLGLPVYASLPEKAAEMQQAGVPVAGTLDDLLKKVDVVADCTPKGIGAQNLTRYRTAGVKAILQGGEKHGVTGHSFVAQANFESARGRDSTRVVSCNTTATVRTLGALKSAGLLAKARGVLIRRATDPWEADHSGIMNTVVPEAHIPSHQGPDAQTVLPDLDVITVAAKAAHTQCHLHYWIVELTRPATPDDVLDAFHAAPRIAVVRMRDGVVALNSTVELMRDLGRPRGDLWEVALWEDVVTVHDREAIYSYQVFNEAIVVPETIDAIRALVGNVADAQTSIAKTDSALGIRRDFLAPVTVPTPAARS